MSRIGIILGSTRPNRNGEQVARWVLEAASRRHDAHFELLACRARRFRAVRAERPDLVARQRAQRRDVGGGGPPADRADPDDPDTQRRFRHGQG